MEWIAEAILLIFAGTLVLAVTARFGAHGAATQLAAACSAAALIVLAAVSAATGGAGRLHHVPPVHADLPAVGGADAGRRLRLA